jgi:hypothetical protein
MRTRLGNIELAIRLGTLFALLCVSCERSAQAYKRDVQTMCDLQASSNARGLSHVLELFDLANGAWLREIR